MIKFHSSMFNQSINQWYSCILYCVRSFIQRVEIGGCARRTSPWRIFRWRFSWVAFTCSDWHRGSGVSPHGPTWPSTISVSMSARPMERFECHHATHAFLIQSWLWTCIKYWDVKNIQEHCNIWRQKMAMTNNRFISNYRNILSVLNSKNSNMMMSLSSFQSTPHYNLVFFINPNFFYFFQFFLSMSRQI